MILIFVTWIVIFAFFIASGTLLQSILKIENRNMPLTVLCGMFSQVVILTAACFFTNLGWRFFVFNAVFHLLVALYFRNKILLDTQIFFLEIKQLSFYSKVVLSIILILGLYKCACTPFLIDNESYYLQTIKWINEYGFVKGLANLHIFLAI